MMLKKYASLIFVLGACIMLLVLFIPHNGENYKISHNDKSYICGDYIQFSDRVKGYDCKDSVNQYSRIYLSSKDGDILIQKLDK